MKYTLSTTETMQHDGITLYRVLYNNGTVGGWIEGEHNLSQEGECRVWGNAQVCGNAQVFGNAEVYGNARLCGEDVVYGNARVSKYLP